MSTLQAQSTPPDSNRHPVEITFTGFDGDTAFALQGLRAEIASLLPATSYKRMFPSCKVVLISPDSTLIPIYSVNEDKPVLPASVEKLFTSSTILWALGGNYEFTTKLDLGANTRIEGSSVVGNVYLRPSGDPTLTMHHFDSLARALQTKGITQIEGDIVSDLSDDDILSADAKHYFEKENEVLNSSQQNDSLFGLGGGAIADAEGWMDEDPKQKDNIEEVSEEEEEEGDMTGFISTSANFFVDRNIISIRVQAGSKAGAPVSVSVYPPVSSIKIVNRASTSRPMTVSRKRVKVGKGKKARWKTVTRRSKSPYTLRVVPSGTSIGDEQSIITVTGLIPARINRSYSIPIRNVPLTMADLLKWRLEVNGVKVTGSARTGVPSDKSKELINLVEKRTSLIDLLKVVNKKSDNFLAEAMFRKLSSIADVRETESLQRSKRMMESWMKVLNVNTTGVEFADGSGLSRANFSTATSVIQLLSGIYQRKEMYPDFLSTLTVAGVDGTTRGRMINTPAWGNAHSKTGTLNGVTALAGYVATKDKQLAAYFITMQNFGGGSAGYKRIQDAIVTKLASFSYSDYHTKYGPPPTLVPVTAPAVDPEVGN